MPVGWVGSWVMKMDPCTTLSWLQSVQNTMARLLLRPVPTARPDSTIVELSRVGQWGHFYDVTQLNSTQLVLEF